MTGAIETAAHPAALRLRGDFPALAQDINGKPLTYLDSAASAQQPAAVIERVAEYQRHGHANVHRGVHTLSQRATEAYEGARDALVRFINAERRSEVIFTSGTTAAINLVAQSFLRPRLRAGDRILVTHLEHHSNIVPWQLVAGQAGAEVIACPIDDHGDVDLETLVGLMGPGVRMLAIAHVSNALGTVLPVADIAAAARQRGIPVLVDGAQAVPHGAVDVRALGCDFYAFSGHKMFGPTGIGVLYGREALLEEMPPWQGGGDMILEVRIDGSTYTELPYKFEAGTPNISGAVGLGAAVEYLSAIGMERVRAYEQELHACLVNRLEEVPGLRLVGTARGRTGVQSFLLDDIHPHDLGTILDHEGVAIRTGHHCAMPVMERYGIPGTARASIALYNGEDDVDRLVDALATARRVFG